MRKVRPESPKMAALEGPRMVWMLFGEGSASSAVVLGRVFRAVLQVLGQVFAELFDTPSTPLCETGSADLKGSALPADPIKIKNKYFIQTCF